MHLILTQPTSYSKNSNHQQWLSISVSNCAVLCLFCFYGPGTGILVDDTTAGLSPFAAVLPRRIGLSWDTGACVLFRHLLYFYQGYLFPRVTNKMDKEEHLKPIHPNHTSSRHNPPSPPLKKPSHTKRSQYPPTPDPQPPSTPYAPHTAYRRTPYLPSTQTQLSRLECTPLRGVRGLRWVRGRVRRIGSGCRAFRPVGGGELGRERNGMEMRGGDYFEGSLGKGFVLF